MGKIMTTVSADPELLDIVTQLRRLADRTDRWFDQKENRENFVEGDYKVADEIPELFYSLEDSLLSLLAYKISYDLNDLF